MPITTIEQVYAAPRRVATLLKDVNIAGSTEERVVSYWTANSVPLAGFGPSNTVTGEIPTRLTTGAMEIPLAAVGNRQHIVGAQIRAPLDGFVILFDRVYQAGSFSVVSGPAPGFIGLAVDRPAGGLGNEIWLELTGAGGVAFIATITYVNESGTPGRTAVGNWSNDITVGRMLPVPLQAGDSGVQQITGVSFNTTTANTAVVLLLRRMFTAAITDEEQAVDLGLGVFGARPIERDACLFAAIRKPFGVTAFDVNFLSIILDLAEG